VQWKVLPGDDTAVVIDEHVMIFRAPFGIRHDTLKHLCDTFGDDAKARFFQNLATNSRIQCLSRFERASGKRPVSSQGLTASLRQQDSGAVEDERSYTQDWPIWITPANKSRLP
jgi:hypothetical protein